MFKEYIFSSSLLSGNGPFQAMESIAMVVYQFLYFFSSSISLYFDGVLELFESGVFCLLSEIHKMQVQYQAVYLLL